MTRLTLLALLLLAAPLRADIFRWDNGELIPGTEGIVPGPGITVYVPSHNLSFANFAGMDLTNSEVCCDLYKADFTGSILLGASVGSSLRSAKLINADLTNAIFGRYSSFVFLDTDFTGATITGVDLSFGTDKYLTKEQLYSTASYQAKNLRGIKIGTDLRGWDLSGQDLTGAVIEYGANLDGALLTDATYSTPSSAIGARIDRSNGGISLADLLTTPNYAAKDLSHIKITSANWSGADFSGFDLSGTILEIGGELGLTGADFSSANLTGATLRGSLNAARFHGASLRGVNLADADGFNAAGADTRGMIWPDGKLREFYMGDSNMDDRFDSGDLVTVFQAGRYSNEQPASWQQGDWSLDGFFDSSDLVAAFQAGNYDSETAATVGVPEVISGWWLLTLLLRRRNT